MLEILPQSEGANIACKASGIISEADYEAILPDFEQRIKDSLHFRILLDWEQLEGWETENSANRFGVRFMHRYRCERIAIVSTLTFKSSEVKDLQAVLPRSSELQLFSPAEWDAAWAWLVEK